MSDLLTKIQRRQHRNLNAYILRDQLLPDFIRRLVKENIRVAFQDSSVMFCNFGLELAGTPSCIPGVKTKPLIRFSILDHLFQGRETAAVNIVKHNSSERFSKGMLQSIASVTEHPYDSLLLEDIK